MARDVIQEVNTAVAGSGASAVLNELGQHALGYALPLGVPWQGKSRLRIESDTVEENTGTAWNNEGASLALRREDGSAYRFPIDPVIGVSGKNVIAKRQVSKGSQYGTVKESWSVDDWSVTVNGVLIGCDAEELNRQVSELVAVAESGETLKIENEWLNRGIGVTQVVVESLSLPHTKGLTNQAYSLKLVSDYSAEILERK